jgi:hypothetical protein
MNKIPDNSQAFSNSILSKISFILSIFTMAYWLSGKILNLKESGIAGVIFEILWLPMILLLIGLPVLSLILLIRDKVNLRSFYLYAFIVSVTNIVLTIFIQ